MRRALTLSVVVVAAIALLSLGVGGVAGAGSTGSTVDDAPASATAAECDVGDGPDLVGCWNGTHYESELPFNQSDGLNESELEALTHLTMARVEHVRERPFREDVPVETVTRSAFMNESTGGNNTSDEAFRRWNDQVWEALFVVGEGENANDEIDTVFGGAVSGFYSPSEDRIVLVVAEGEEPQVDPSTLAHELVHGMQDQYHDLTRPRYAGATQDGDLAVRRRHAGRRPRGRRDRRGRGGLHRGAVRRPLRGQLELYRRARRDRRGRRVGDRLQLRHPPDRPPAVLRRRALRRGTGRRRGMGGRQRDDERTAGKHR